MEAEKEELWVLHDARETLEWHREGHDFEAKPSQLSTKKPLILAQSRSFNETQPEPTFTAYLLPV